VGSEMCIRDRNYSNGIYFVKVETKGSNFIKKFIKTD
jgi:hypothetical protein